MIQLTFKDMLEISANFFFYFIYLFCLNQTREMGEMIRY